MRQSMAILVVLLILSPVLPAQPLADRVPDEAMLYMGWAGSEILGDTYKGSNLKAVLDNSKIRDLFSQFFPQVARKIIENEPDAEKPLNILMSTATMMWKHPHAIFAWVDFSNPNEPMPRVGLICKAGKDAPALVKQIDGLLAEVGDTPIPLQTLQQDDLVAVLIGFDDPAKALAGAGNAGPIAQSGSFAAALKQVQQNPALIFYVDVEKLLTQAEAAMLAGDAPDEVKQKIPVALDSSGLRGLKRIIKSAAFDGKEWMSMGFVEAPAPRKGLLSMMEPKPISADLLKAIPVDATFVATARIDPARFINELRTAAGTVDPRGPEFIDMGLGAVQVALAKNLLNDILTPMGEDWAMYCSPSASGNGVLGLVVVNKLDDPAKAQASYPTAAINLSNWVAVAMQQNDADVEIRGRMAKIGDLNVYYVGLPIAAPAWTMKDGYLFLGLYPQSAASGARALTRLNGKCIADNEKFQAVQKRLDVTNPVSVSFYDLPAVASTGWLYQQWMMICRYGGFGDLFGIPFPEPLMPPLDVLQQSLSPAGSAAWIDDAGYHVKSITPFPGARLLSEPGLFAEAGAPIAAGFAVAGVVIPSLQQEGSQRARSAAHLKMMGAAMQAHAADRQGQLPGDLRALVDGGFIAEELLVSPFGNGGPHFNYVAPPDLQLDNLEAFVVVAYDQAALDSKGATNVLFVDGHVEWMSDADLQKALQRSAEQGAKKR